MKANCFKLMKKNLGERKSVCAGNGVANTADVLLSSRMKIEDLGNDI